MINRYFKPTVYQGNFYTPPLDLLSQSLKQAQATYDQNFDYSQSIKDYFINALPQDRAGANAIQQGWSSKIDEIVSTYSGDYSQATRDLQRLTSDIKRELGPGGRGNQMEVNYHTWNEAWKNAQEGVAKGTYTQSQVSLMKQNFDSTYKGIGERDPTTGTYAQANPVTLAPYVNANKIVAEALKDLKPKKYKTFEERFVNGQKRSEMVEVEKYDPVEIEARTSQALGENDQWMAYVSQMAKFNGLDPQQAIREEYSNIVDTTKNFYRGNVKGQEFVQSRSEATQVDRDPLYIESVKHSYRMSEMRQRAALDRQHEDYKKAVELGLTGPQAKEDIRAFGYKSMSQFSPIDKSKGVMVSAPYSGINNVNSAGFGGYDSGVAGKFEKASAEQILANPKKYESAVNIPLLKAAYTKAQKEGKADVSGVALDYYNNMLDKNHTGEALMYRAYPHSSAMKEQAVRIIPILDSGSAVVYKYDNRTHSFTEIGADKAAEDIKGAKDPVALGTTSVINGVKAGTVMTGASGVTYVVAEGNEDIRRLNEEIVPRAFGFANSPTRLTGGDPFQIPGTNQMAYGKIVYDDNLQEQPRYFDPATGEMISVEIEPGRSVPMSPEILESRIYTKEDRARFAPRGESKAKATPFQ